VHRIKERGFRMRRRGGGVCRGVCVYINIYIIYDRPNLTKGSRPAQTAMAP
jgi:hypothetical protein